MFNRFNKSSVLQAAVTLLCSFCTSTKADISQFISTLLHSILLRFNDSDLEVVEISWNALSSVTKVRYKVLNRKKSVISNYSLQNQTFLPFLFSSVQIHRSKSNKSHMFEELSDTPRMIQKTVNYLDFAYSKRLVLCK